jgi:mono/diheme cytochrome c family protein
MSKYRALRCALIAATLVLFGFDAQSSAEDAIRNKYILNCAGCHGIEGGGLPEVGIPDFHESGQFLNLPSGREYLIQVPGVSQAHLSNAEIAQLMNWILVTFSKKTMPENFQPFTDEEIRILRPNKASDAVARRLFLKAQLSQVHDGN